MPQNVQSRKMDRIPINAQSPKTEQKEEIENMARSIISNEIESVIKNRWLHRWIPQTFKQELTSIPSKLFKKISEKETLLN